MVQDENFIKSREQVKKFIKFSKWLGGCKSSTYQKISGGIVNGCKNPDLTETDIEQLFSVIEKAREEIQDMATNGLKSIYEFENEVKRIRG